MGHRLCFVIAVAGLMAATVSAQTAQPVPITVERVVTGDTMTVVLDGQQVEVRLTDIGAPIGSEFYAPSSRTLLASMAEGKKATLVVTGRSGPSRVFGRVRVGEIDLSLEMVQRAAAWVCWDYALSTDYLPYENRNKRLGAGLWMSTTDLQARTRCRERPSGPAPVGGAPR